MDNFTSFVLLIQQGIIILLVLYIFYRLDTVKKALRKSVLETVQDKNKICTVTDDLDLVKNYNSVVDSYNFLVDQYNSLAEELDKKAEYISYLEAELNYEHRN